MFYIQYVHGSGINYFECIIAVSSYSLGYGAQQHHTLILMPKDMLNTSNCFMHIRPFLELFVELMAVRGLTLMFMLWC